MRRIEENTKALWQISEAIKKGHKSCDESPEAAKQSDRARIVPTNKRENPGSVAAVSAPIASGRSFPSLPRPNDDDDDRDIPEHSEIQGASRVRVRPRTDTLGSWFEDPNDDDKKTRKLPRVDIIGALTENNTEVQRLPACAACGSIEVEPIGGLFGCNQCGNVGAMRRPSPVPPSPDPPLFVG